MNTDFKQTVTLRDRKLFEADKIDEVIAFDENGIVLSTLGMELVISGSDLAVVSLDSEKKTIAVKGEIDAVVYETVRKKKGIISRVFK